MIQHVDTVGYGRPATTALARTIAEVKAAGALRPITVIVGSNFVGLSLRRLLGSGELGGSGLVNVQFMTPFQVAELLSPDSLGGRRPLTNPVLGAAVRQALAADPGPFAAVVHHPATEAALAGLYGELSQVSADTLDVLERAGGTAAPSVATYRRVASLLTDFYGEPDLADAVSDRPDLRAVSGRLGHLVWFLPEVLTPALERMFRSVLEVVDSSVVIGHTGDGAADSPVLDVCRRVGVDVDETATAPVPPVGSEIISVADPDEEVRAVVRRILDLTEAGVRLDRIGIFYPRTDPYTQTLHQQLAEAAIACNGPSRERLADSVAGRTLLGALSLPAQHWRRDRVMALVAAAPVRNGDQPVFPTSWELLSRTAGVVQGLDDWARKLAARRHAFTERASIVDGPEASNRTRWLQAECDDIDALGAFVTQLAERVTAVTRAMSWSAKSDAARDLIVHLLGAEHRRQSWPEREQEAAGRVDDALVRLAHLDEIEPGPAHDVFVRALTNELDVGRGRVGRFGHGVMFGPLVTAAGQDLDAVFLLGMAEGLCPSPRREDSLLADAARSLAQPGELPLRARRLDDQHRSYLAALAAAPAGRRVLLHPRGDLRGGSQRLASRWLLDTASVLWGSRVYSTDFGQLGAPVVDVIASHAMGVLTSGTAASLIERDLQELAALAGGGCDIHGHPATAGSVGRGILSQHARRSEAFTAFDGNLGGSPVPSPARDGSALSPTGLEQWAGCGFRYFLDHVLHLRVRDEPERIHELSALDRGSGVHTILERFFRWVIADGAPDPGTPWSSAHRQRMLEVADEVFDELERTGRTGRPVRWRLERRRLTRLLEGFLVNDDEMRARWQSRPEQVELPFGLDGADPVTVTLPDGRAIRFRGKADRVDRTESGEWIVLDYKTGKGVKYRNLHDDRFMAGTTLQLALYAEAARQRLGGDDASAFYWMIDESVDFQRLGYEWIPELRARFVELITTMVDGIEAGVFPAAPGKWDSFGGSYENCRHCDFDAVCPRERGTQATTKLGAPEMALRRALIPPELADDDEDGPQ